MARSQAGNETGDVDNGIARRAATALELNHPGPNKDKRIAQALLISPGMAKQLRAGRGWTVARLDQAMRLFPGFRDLVFPPTTDEIQGLDRLDRLDGTIAALRDEIRRELALLRDEIRGVLALLRDEIRSLKGD
jgi:hypothetical protein